MQSLNKFLFSRFTSRLHKQNQTRKHDVTAEIKAAESYFSKMGYCPTLPTLAVPLYLCHSYKVGHYLQEHQQIIAVSCSAGQCTDTLDLRHFGPKTFRHWRRSGTIVKIRDTETLQHQCQSVLDISAPLL